MAFDDTRKSDVLETYELVRITLPMVATVCTLGDGEGWYTPKTCREEPTGFYSRWFARPEYDHMANFFVRKPTANEGDDFNIYPCLDSISETPTKLEPGEGLGSRGTIRLTFTDFEGDPGPVRTSGQGKFFEKMEARNVMEGGTITLFLGYRTGLVPTSADFMTKQYRIEELENNGDGTWTITGKDALYLLDKEEAVWPAQTNGRLRAGLNETTTTIPVDADTDYSGAQVIRIGDELMTVTGVSNNQTATATLTVQARGSSINVGGTLVSRTEADEHDTGDEVFICEVSDNERLDDLLFRILTDIGISPALINQTEWADEIDLWHPTTLVTTVWTTAEDANDRIAQITRDFLLDIWYDVVAAEVKLSAISVWRQSDLVLRDGYEINSHTLSYSNIGKMRYNRASVAYSKRNLTESDDIENYRKLSVFADARSESVYGDVRLKQLENSILLDRNSGDLLVQRYVSRFSDAPREYRWSCPERYLDFSVGDVADLEYPTLVGFDGTPARPRAQVTSIRPRYGRTGRSYEIRALTYEQPASTDGTGEFTLSGRIFNLDLFIQAGAPPEPVEVTFILNNITIGSGSTAAPAIRAGNFAAGSKINLIVNGIMSSRGGSGGLGGSYYSENDIDRFCTPGTDGGDGGDVYSSDGIDTDIYLAGSLNGISADGRLYAPGGGGKGGNARCGSANFPQPDNYGCGGGGGAGIGGGPGGTVREFGYPHPIPTSAYGSPGQEDGTPGQPGTPSNLGFDGEPGATWGQDASFGLAGKGLVKTGTEVINVFVAGDNTRFLNGNGDAPDAIDPTP